MWKTGLHFFFTYYPPYNFYIFYWNQNFRKKIPCLEKKIGLVGLFLIFHLFGTRNKISLDKLNTGFSWSEFQKKDMMWQIKTKLSSQRPPASVSFILILILTDIRSGRQVSCKVTLYGHAFYKGDLRVNTVKPRND